MPRNEDAALSQVCSGIRIHAIDIVQPPGIGIPLIADIDHAPNSRQRCAPGEEQP
jgi:hypothetical protein